MLQQWLHALDDAAIADWANKGLLKRGAKTLAACDSAQWTLAADAAAANIEGHTQRLGGVGFAQLACDCPAFGPCHHLCAFLLGLRARLLAQAEAGAGEVVERAPARPWLEGEAASIEQAFGAAATRRALQWLARSFEAELEEGDAGLVGQLLDPEEATVRVPRAGGLAAATCTCKAASCAHRALVVVQARQAAGAAIPQLPALGLEAPARARLGQLEDWLVALVLQGSAGVGPAFVDQGEALATELRQADLPRLGATLQGLVQLLRDDQARRGGAAERLPDALAAVWVLVRGLRREPMPRPFTELAGVHRRSYRRLGGLLLHGVGAEVWETLAGQRGFSVYFHAPESGRYFSWSESRARDLDPQWQPAEALEQARLAGIAATALLQRGHRLECGWASADGRLSARDGTRLSVAEGAAPACPADDLATLLQGLGERLRADPWQRPPPLLARLAVGEVGALQVDRALQRWSLPLGDPHGISFTLRGELAGFQGLACRRLQAGLAAGHVPSEVFGRLSQQDGLVVLAPISVRWADASGLLHLSAPKLATSRGVSHA